MSAPPESVLLYDGLCGLCDGVVQFTMQRDQKGSMQFAPLQGVYARALLVRHPELASIDSLIVVRAASSARDEQVLVRSDAAIAIAQYLGGPWALLGRLTRVFPRVLRDWGYNLIARSRYRIFGKRDVCRIPDARERARFLD